MWYRLYLAKMPKKDYEKMVKMSYDDFFEKYWDKSRLEDTGEKDLNWLYEFTERLFALGKYVDYSDWMEKVEFADDKLNNRYDDRNFHKLDKAIIKSIIEDYSQNVAEYYKWLFEWFDGRGDKKSAKQKNQDIYKHLQQRYYDFSWKRIWKKTSKWKKYKIFRWSRPFNIEEWVITKSWEYEYLVFELIRIYRGFDEEKDVLLYYWF